MSDIGLVESLSQTGRREAGSSPVTVMSASGNICLVCAAPAQRCSQELLQQTAAALLRGLVSMGGALCAPCSDLAAQACHLHSQLNELDDRLRLRHAVTLYSQLGDGDSGWPALTKHPLEGERGPDRGELACRLCAERLDSAADLVRHLRSRHGAEPTAGTQLPTPCAPCTRCRCGQSAGRDTEHSPAAPGPPSDRPPAVPGLETPPDTASQPLATPADTGGGGQLVCAACPQRFDSSAQRRRHLRQAHPLLLAHACAICGKRFPSPSKLRIHEDSHAGARPHGCHVCGRRYLSAQKLHVHARSHTGERPFVCHMCGRTFAAAAYLVQHELTHTGRRPHQCHACGKQFAQRGTMMKHVRSVHGVVVAQQPASPTHVQQVAAVGRAVAPGPS